MKIKIKALSVNQCWQGRRFKTKLYQSYEEELFYLLPKGKIDKINNLSVEINIGYSNKLADIDNFIKPFLDILQKKYGFNDHQIYKLMIEKIIIPKGHEFIEYGIYKT